MIQRPAFKTNLTVEVLDSTSILVFSTEDWLKLEGRLFALIAPQVDGLSSVDEITERLQGQVSKGDVQFGLFFLEQKGCIQEADHDFEAAVLQLLLSPFSSQAESAPRVKDSQTPMDDGSDLRTAVLKGVSDSAGPPVVQWGGVLVVLTDDYLREELSEFHSGCLRRGASWMPVRARGTVLWWGPVFRPGGACWFCLARRLRANRTNWTDSGWSAPDAPRHLRPRLEGALRRLAGGLCTGRAEPADHALQSHIFTLDLKSTALSCHELAKEPLCPACVGTIRGASPGPANGTASTGAESSVSEAARDLRSRIRQHVSPLTGIVSNLRTVYESTEPSIHVCTARLSPVPGAGARSPANHRLQNWCCGSGETMQEAQRNTLSEALERYSGFYFGYETLQKSTYRSLGAEAIHPNEVMRFSSDQYRNRQAPSRGEAPSQCVPEPLDEDCEIEWAPVWSMTRKKTKHLPAACCYYGLRESPGWRFCRADSSGTAAGGTLEEAIVRGFFELVERDSVAIWWYNQVQRPEFDLDSFGDSRFTALAKHYSRLKRTVRLLDLTSDLEVPVIAAISTREEGGLSDLMMGFGCHMDPSRAAFKALSEMNQLFPQILRGVKTAEAFGLNGFEPGDFTWLEPSPGQSRSRERFLHNWPSASRDQVSECCQIALRHGLDLLVLDQTRRWTGRAVARVFAPGLRPWWARFGPGRLYEVPVLLGWRNTTLREQDLNPSHLTL